MSNVTTEHRVGTMTTIKTTCDHCGEIHLGPSDIALELGSAGSDGSYRFVCPDCFSVQRRPATRRVVSILLATGVSYEVTVTPRGPITTMEVDEFATLLGRDDWFERLTPSEGSNESF